MPPPSITVDKFPSDSKSDYQDVCQVLIEDKTNEKQLWVCRFFNDSDLPSFHLYSFSDKDKPERITKLREISEEEIEIELKAKSDSRNKTIKISKPSKEWKKLLGIKFETCKFAKGSSFEAPWKISCQTENSNNKELFSTLLVIK